MTANIIQFAPIFDAVGAKINLKTNTLEAEVLEYPKGKKGLVEAAVNDLIHYLDTRTYEDGVAAFAIASYIDGEPNPISDTSKRNLLESLGLTKDGKYISQVISLQKINKSWHVSDVPNECSFFGEVCTHRGITEVEGKRGRKATRSPNEYHRLKANGNVDREQLVTPALDALHRAIPDGVMVSATKPKEVFRLDEIERIDPDLAKQILEKINKVREQRNVTV